MSDHVPNPHIATTFETANPADFKLFTLLIGFKIALLQNFGNLDINQTVDYYAQYYSQLLIEYITNNYTLLKINQLFEWISSQIQLARDVEDGSTASIDLVEFCTLADPDLDTIEKVATSWIPTGFSTTKELAQSFWTSLRDRLQSQIAALDIEKATARIHLENNMAQSPENSMTQSDFDDVIGFYSYILQNQEGRVSDQIRLWLPNSGAKRLEIDTTNFIDGTKISYDSILRRLRAQTGQPKSDLDLALTFQFSLVKIQEEIGKIQADADYILDPYDLVLSYLIELTINTPDTLAINTQDASTIFRMTGLQYQRLLQKIRDFVIAEIKLVNQTVQDFTSSAD